MPQFQQKQLPLIVVACILLVLVLFSSSIITITTADAQATNDIDYTCFPRKDYSKTNQCEGIQNGVCDAPNHGGSGGDACLNQDCIDCNTQCKYSKVKYEKYSILVQASSAGDQLKTFFFRSFTN